MTTIRKKLIEHSIPLDAINAAAGAEKQIKVGKHTSIHQWFAPRPLATNRAAIFCQLVDDPSACPDVFPTEIEQERERRRLHALVVRLSQWPKSDARSRREFAEVLEEARWEIAVSISRGTSSLLPERTNAEEVRRFVSENAPAVVDPFCGGGSIPLEAQRLGAFAYAQDLNPVPASITRALVEFPARFVNSPPVAADSDELISEYTGASGLASDVRHYASQLETLAEEAVGSAYAPVNPSEQVVAWLWAKTVPSPDPSASGAHVPISGSFVLSDKSARIAIVEPVVDRGAPNGWRFVVETRDVSEARLKKAHLGTKSPSGGYKCFLTGTPITTEYLREQGKLGNIEERMMAVVLQGDRRRNYRSVRAEDELHFAKAEASWHPHGELDARALGFRVPGYGYMSWADFFNRRQLATLAKFSELIGDIRERVLLDASKAHWLKRRSDERGLFRDGAGVEAYADAIAFYLALCVDRLAQCQTRFNRWFVKGEKIQPTFDQHTLPMVWDYGEGNAFGTSTGSFAAAVKYPIMALERWGGDGPAQVELGDAREIKLANKEFIVTTDPPYYDNIGYADLSDFFYVWLKSSLRSVDNKWFRRTLTDKRREIVANPAKSGGKETAEAEFITGMSEVFKGVYDRMSDDFPMIIYYAFKQSEAREQGVLSPGWATFLQALINSGWVVDATWPVRSEHSSRSRAIGSNALASSVLLVCRKRSPEALRSDRRSFKRELRADLTNAIERHQKAGVPLPDRRQAAVGPGIGTFSTYSEVLESDDNPMSVATALALINREIDAILDEGSEDLDAETRFAFDWYQQFGYGLQKGKAGDAIQQLQGFNLDINSINASGLFRARHGDAKLLSRDEMEDAWTPSKDATFTLWEMAQHLARALTAEDGGLAKCGQLLAEKPTAAADVLLIAERMFEMATTRGENDEALVWNQLQTSWPGIETAADEANERGYSPAPEQADLL